MACLALDSYAKLNLFLSVRNIRKDNYHNIKTVFERIGLCDRIILKPRRDNKIKITCSDLLVPRDNSNLCYKSARLLQDYSGIKKGLDIEIIKRIPVGAGLGGGSSNAASMLLGLNILWQLNLPRETLAKLAGKIGSDVPFFIYDVSFAQGIGRGEKIKPLQALKSLRLWHILVVPKIAVSTPLIYQKWDSFSRLTRAHSNVKLLLLALRRKDQSLAGKFLFNSLETVTSALYPQVGRIKRQLSGFGVKSILMSGSGPAVFGIVSSRKEAVTLQRQLGRENRSWRVFAVKTV